MADFSSLKQTIQSFIKQNGNEEITGNILQDVLLAMVSTMGDGAINSLASALQNETTERQNQDATLQGNISTLGGRIDTLQTAINGINTKLAEGYIYAGIATPSTNPGTISGKVFYIAVQEGTYTNFGGTVVTEGITILKYNGTSWVKEQVIFTDGGVFDISAYHATGGTLAKYVDLAAALDGGNNIPQSVRKGGMSIKFVQSSDNKYVQCRLMADSFTIDTTKWAVCDEGVYDDNPEFAIVFLDSKKRIGYGLKKNGDFYFGAGCPQQVKDYITPIVNSLLSGINAKVDKVSGKGLSTNDYTNDDKSVVELERLTENREWLYALLDAKMRLVEGMKFDGKKEVYIDTFFNKVRFLSDESKQEFIDYLDVQQRQTLSQLVVDLPVSDGTDIQSGYAYIDSTDRCVKVKA